MLVLSNLEHNQALPQNVVIKPRDIQSAFPYQHRLRAKHAASNNALNLHDYVYLSDDAVYLFHRHNGNLPPHYEFNTTPITGLMMLSGTIDTVSVMDEIAIAPGANSLVYTTWVHNNQPAEIATGDV